MQSSRARPRPWSPPSGSPAAVAAVPCDWRPVAEAESAAGGAAASRSWLRAWGWRPSRAGRSHRPAPRACSVPAVRTCPGPGGLASPALHNAGYLHPDVLCHHRPGHPVLHHLPALGTGGCGLEGIMELMAQQPASGRRWSCASGRCDGYRFRNKTKRELAFLSFWPSDASCRAE